MSLKEDIEAFARDISGQQIGLVIHQPEGWARQLHCFANVFRKVEMDGGAVKFGWTFQHRIASDKGGEYLIATHHAVWHRLDGKLVDITPFHNDRKHHPIQTPDGIIFLVDDAAEPSRNENKLAPLPLRFYPLGSDKRLISYVEELNREEIAKAQRMYS